MLALKGDTSSEFGVASIERLLDALDSHVDLPDRASVIISLDFHWEIYEYLSRKRMEK